mgnify:FL=1|tara:strand:- start:3399 stop:4298 length:900 start_codon:yes stop_codon:yes gene_type:complete
MSFNTLSELRKKSSNIDSLQKAVDKLTSPKSDYKKGDEREWKPTVDSAGNGYAVIRFLPLSKGAGEGDVPWVRIFNHGFQGPGGKWYIENSLTTLNEQDPVSELNTQLWNSGIEADKETARKQKRRLNYWANILIVDDPANPANNGKVFIYKFGKKIFDKIQDQLKPEFQDESPINPFDFWEGANFKLKIRQVEGYRNYDKSEFETPSPIAEGDEAIEKVWNEQHDLGSLIAPDQFKSYEELKAKLNMVLGSSTPVATAETVAQETVEEVTPQAAPVVTDTSDDEDDTLSYFKQLAEDK